MAVSAHTSSLLSSPAHHHQRRRRRRLRPHLSSPLTSYLHVVLLQPPTPSSPYNPFNDLDLDLNLVPVPSPGDRCLRRFSGVVFGPHPSARTPSRGFFNEYSVAVSEPGVYAVALGFSVVKSVVKGRTVGPLEHPSLPLPVPGLALSANSVFSRWCSRSLHCRSTVVHLPPDRSIPVLTPRF